MHEGTDADGEHLYPAFPYPLLHPGSAAPTPTPSWPILKTVPAGRYTAAAPTGCRSRSTSASWSTAGTCCSSSPAASRPDPSKSAAWNRGAYLVTGSATAAPATRPRTCSARTRTASALQGGTLDNWVAPDLTANPRTGLGALERRRHRRIPARPAATPTPRPPAPMAEVVTYSTSLLTDADLARHRHLSEGPCRPSRVAAPGAADAGAMRRGAAIYSDACAACHLTSGASASRASSRRCRRRRGCSRPIRPASSTSSWPAAAPPRPPTRPTPLTMPSFAWKLTDQQIADVATYVRNSWGNHAGAGTASRRPDARACLRAIAWSTVPATKPDAGRRREGSTSSLESHAMRTPDHCGRPGRAAGRRTRGAGCRAARSGPASRWRWRARSPSPARRSSSSSRTATASTR